MPIHELNEKLGDSLADAIELIQKNAGRRLKSRWHDFRGRLRLVDQVIDASMGLFNYILEDIVRENLDDTEKRSKEVKQGIDAVNESIAALVDP